MRGTGPSEAVRRVASCRNLPVTFTLAHSSFMRTGTILVLAGLLTGLAYFSWRQPQHQQITVHATGVDEIALAFDPAGGADLGGAVMGLGYARWANFRRILKDGEWFIQVGSGASFIRKGTTATRYVVREGFRTQAGPFGALRYATLRIEDSRTGKANAAKEWLCDGTECRKSADDPEGWPGQYAALFVRSALNPTTPLGGNIGTKVYPSTVATVEHRVPTKPLSRAELTANVFGCPSDFRVFVRKDINETVLAGNDWMFVAQSRIRQVRCTTEGVFVFSATFPEDIYIDWLAPSGELRGQYYIRAGRSFPASDGGTFPFFSDIRVTPDVFEIQMNYVHRRWPSADGSPALPEWELVTKVSRNQSAHKHAP